MLKTIYLQNRNQKQTFKMCSSTQLVKPNGRICMNCFPLVKRAPLLSPSDTVRFFDSCTKFKSGAPNGSVPQNICSSGQVFLAGKFGEINMSLEGKCCWAIHNLGCQRGFVVYNSLYILFFISPSPIEGVNVSLRPHPIAYAPPPLKG